MAEIAARPSTRIDPGPAWSVVTDAPLKGMALAREAVRVLAWDEVGQLYLIDARGQFLSATRAPGEILGAAISDDGSLVALLGERSRLWLLGADLETIEDRSAPVDSSAVAVDPLGRYLAVATKSNLVQFHDRFGKRAGRFETRQYLSHLAFVPAAPTLIGVGAYGSINAYDLTEPSPGKLSGELAWTEQIMSGVGRLALTGDGGMILLGCHTYGVQRYDIQGRNDGAYHLGGSATLAVPDFAGRTIAVATQEGDLAIMSGTGTVRWRTTLARPALGLEVDALGRFLVYGLDTGEITLLDFQGGGRTDEAQRSAPVAVSARGGAGPVRPPDWRVTVVETDEQAEFAVLAVTDDPPRIGLVTHKNQLQVYGTDGVKVGQAPDLLGVGRIVRSAPGWLAAATDRQVVVYDLARNTGHRVDLSLVELTHLTIRPDGYGIAIVQERDRVGRATLAGRWVWRHELSAPVEDLAIGPEGYTALTTEDGRLIVHDPAGTEAGGFRGTTPEPLLLAEAPSGSARGVVWMTLSRRSQVIRGHDLLGRVVWESPTPWDGWGFHSIGPTVVVSAADGRAVAYDGSGHARARSAKADGPLDLFQGDASGAPVRISKTGVHLICSDFQGQVTWRAFADAPIGPIAAGTSGVAAMVGRSLAWFGADPGQAGSKSGQRSARPIP